MMLITCMFFITGINIILFLSFYFDNFCFKNYSSYMLLKFIDLTFMLKCSYLEKRF